jgi:hypothetical protein
MLAYPAFWLAAAALALGAATAAIVKGGFAPANKHSGVPRLCVDGVSDGGIVAAAAVSSVV